MESMDLPGASKSTLLKGDVLKAFRGYGLETELSADGAKLTIEFPKDGFVDMTTPPAWDGVWKLDIPEQARYTLFARTVMSSQSCGEWAEIPLGIESRDNGWIMLHTPSDLNIPLGTPDAGGYVDLRGVCEFLTTERDDSGKRVKRTVSFNIVEVKVLTPETGVGALGKNAPGNVHCIGPRLFLYVGWGAQQNGIPVMTSLTIHTNLTEQPWV